MLLVYLLMHAQLTIFVPNHGQQEEKYPQK